MQNRNAHKLAYMPFWSALLYSVYTSDLARSSAIQHGYSSRVNTARPYQHGLAENRAIVNKKHKKTGLSGSFLGPWTIFLATSRLPILHWLLTLLVETSELTGRITLSWRRYSRMMLTTLLPQLAVMMPAIPVLQMAMTPHQVLVLHAQAESQN